MKTPSSLFFILIVLVFNACNSPSADYSKYSDFMSVKNIQFEEHDASVLLGMPMDMLVMNDLVIVLDAQTDRFFMFFRRTVLIILAVLLEKEEGRARRKIFGCFLRNTLMMRFCIRPVLI
jgi:hypothetical protein